MLELDVSLLISKLNDLVEIYGVNCNQITSESGVYNIAKIIKGKTAPTLQSWAKLHEAFPRAIPEPQYVDGKKIYISADNQSRIDSANLSGRDMHIENNNPLSVDEQFLINLLREKDQSKKHLRKYIQELLGLE